MAEEATDVRLVSAGWKSAKGDAALLTHFVRCTRKTGRWLSSLSGMTAFVSLDGRTQSQEATGPARKPHHWMTGLVSGSVDREGRRKWKNLAYRNGIAGTNLLDRRCATCRIQVSIQRMRKLIIFFLIVLPLQWSTAAVAAYCQHEAESKAQQHVGHHAHEHEASADLGGSDPADSDFDADCPSCHAHYVQVVIPVDHAATPICGGHNVTPYRTTLPEPPLGSLFRPPLADLA